jgi:type IV pilus assembly protein PilO
MSTATALPPDRTLALPETQGPGRLRGLLTALNLHFAGVAALAVLVLYLLVHLVVLWQGLKARDAAALDDQRAALRSAELAAKPLRGLDEKLVESTQQADKFTSQRLPYATSEVVAELGALTHREGVHLTRAQYSYAPVLSGKYALTEMHMDVGVSGDYRPIVQFVNAVERDKTFFVINGINLTGQQTGQVNLRIRLTTYLRSPVGSEMTAEVPAADSGAGADTGGKR